VDRPRGTAPGDHPDARLFVHKRAGHASDPVSQLGYVVLRNVAQIVAEDIGDIPVGLAEIRTWLADRGRALGVPTT